MKVLWNAGINMHTQLSLDLHVGPKTVNETREKRGEIKFFFCENSIFFNLLCPPYGTCIEYVGFSGTVNITSF